MTYVTLDRRFVSWKEKEGSAFDRLSTRRNAERVTWSELRKRKRVALLAEAGSGKTTELREQARMVTAEGGYGVYAEVKLVAREGLAGSLGPACRARFEEWKASTEPGYFFVDAVDEAKLDRIRVGEASRKMADALGANLSRAYIVLAGRITDWDFRVDLAEFAEHLPVPQPTAPPDVPEGPSVLQKALRGDYRRDARKKAEAAESVSVVLMDALDEPRVRIFAAAAGIDNAQRFVRAIEDADLWFLARRPFDLEWLVRHWKREGRFGSLVEMIDMSLRERLRETNAQHKLDDRIDPERAFEALERIGAALVFTRTEKIEVEDSALALAPMPGALRLGDVLPDWSPEQQRQLLTRAVFDPATFRTVRLHNDNDGAVRAYLAARWLRRLRDEYRSIRPILPLLFSDLYGYRLLRPSAERTSVWLALWDDSVARKVSERQPDLLLQYGDPGSFELSARVALLTRAVESMAGSERLEAYLPEETLRRLASPALAPAIRSLWSAHREHRGCEQLLLRLIWLGHISACADLAQEALAGAWTDEASTTLAGRALVACASSEAIQAFAQRVRAEVPSLPALVLWEAINALFPRYLSVVDLVAILRQMSASQLSGDGYLGADHFLPRCAERLHTRSELEWLLAGVLAVFPEKKQEQEDEEESYSPGSHLRLLGSLATSLMRFVGPGEAPDGAIDIAMRIRSAQRHRTQDEESQALIADLNRASEQRRTVFWHVARAWEHPEPFQGRALKCVWEMKSLGWPLRLEPQDLKWLLADARSAATEREAHLALDAAFDLWSSGGRAPEVLARIQSEAAGVGALADVSSAWLTPRTLSDQERASQKEMEAFRARRERQERDRDDSWQKLVTQLKSDPDQLRNLPVPTRESMDSRLYYLWQLLSSLDGRNTHYALDDLKPLELVVGADVTAAFQEALFKFWRQWQPTLESTRRADHRNQISQFDCIGICAVSVEARLNPLWPGYLRPDEARRAAEYLTLELNGFPAWTARLAVAFPKEVSGVMVGEVSAEMQDTSPTPYVGPLQDLDSAPVEVCRAVAEELFVVFKAQGPLTERRLWQALCILHRGLPAQHMPFRTLVFERIREEADPVIAGCYVAAAFYRESEAALAALKQRLADTAAHEARSTLVESFLPRLQGDRFRDSDHEPPTLPRAVLESLILIAFEAVRVSEDLEHESGVVFSPGPRDAAQDARNALLRQLTQMPGPQTLEALRRIGRSGVTAIAAEQIEALCRERAALDSEGDPWSPRAAYEVEQGARAAAEPQTPAELQAVAVLRLEDLTHELRHGDFTRGTLVKSLELENPVQRFIADELWRTEGGAYSLEREPHVADEKEPDIRLQARASTARLPIEIKDTNSEWTLEELEHGLTQQLCGRYLRAAGDTHGIYLLVHRFPRTWRHKGRTLGFKQVLEHLRAMARDIAAEGPSSPQVEVMAIDIADMAAPSTRRTSKSSEIARTAMQQARRLRGTTQPAQSGRGKQKPKAKGGAKEKANAAKQRPAKKTKRAKRTSARKK